MSTDCDCCAGIGAETPVTVTNRAGLSTLSYRTGTYSQFLASMLAAIGGTTAHGLRTRNSDDFSIAFLDACAITADVLTFYDERNANENYLRTARELLSIGELGRLIGYSLRPGCSASAYLAFRLNDPPVNPDPTSPGAKSAALATLSSVLGVTVPAGTKVQSVPGPGQMPQTFETSADLDARWINNALAPLSTRPYPPGSSNIGVIYLAGGGNSRNAGDRIMLIDNAGAVQLRTVVGISVDGATKAAAVTLDGGGTPTPPPSPIPATASPPQGDFGDKLVAEIVDGQIWDRDDLATLIARRDWSMDAFEATVNAAREAATVGASLQAFAVRQAALFGHNAPLWDSLPPTLRYSYTDSATKVQIDPPYKVSWDSAVTLGGYVLSSFKQYNSIDLDNVYSSIAPGVTLVFFDSRGSTQPLTAQVATVNTVSRSLYGLSGRVTNVTLAGDISALGDLSPRTTTVFIQDAPLALAPIPIKTDIGGTSVLLDRCALRVVAGSYVQVSGERTDAQGRTSVEVAEVAQATLEDGFTRLIFTQPLSGTYKAGTAFFNANVAPATNGETVNEVLGSGDASAAFQAFTLRQMPLTWVPAATHYGIDAAITVRANGVEWTRVPYLYGSAPTDRVYALYRDMSGGTAVQFGDGATFGARLPTGSENVTAVYRRGIGAAGLVGPDSLTMLATRPPGVRDVSNPLAANGAGDPETVEQSRINAPIAVRTLGRIVSLDDYADFVRASGGVAKARVDTGWRGAQRVIIITVAGPAGAPVVDGSLQFNALLGAIQAAAEADYPVALKSYQLRSFSVSAALVTDPAYITDDVYAAVRGALRAAFSFDTRAFGQPVFRSEVIAVIQSVPGVMAATLKSLCYSEMAPATLETRLDALPGALSGSDAVGAELLTIDPVPAVLTVLS
jgi:predicted phage baseplate assembly protein